MHQHGIMTSFRFSILCALFCDAHHKADEEGRRAEGVGGVHEEEPVHTACIRRDEGRGQRNIRRKAECGEIETVFGRRGMQSGLSGAYARTHRDTATRAHKLACVLWWPSWVRAWACVRAYAAAIRWARARHGDKARRSAEHGDEGAAEAVEGRNTHTIRSRHAHPIRSHCNPPTPP